MDITGGDRIDVVGESYYREALGAVARNSLARERVAALVPDPTNPYDRNAVKILIDGEQVGHLSRELASLVARTIGSMRREHGNVTAAAELTGSASGGSGVVLRLDLRRLGVVTVDEDGVVEEPLNDNVPAVSVVNNGPAANQREAAGSNSVAEVSAERRALIEKAVEVWKSDLIDLTARNRLLYFRDLKTGTLSLDEANRDLLMQLIAGRTVALSKLVPRSLPARNPAATLTPFEDAVRRTRAITRTARSYEEERGIKTLFLACGIATWRSDRSSRPPAAPVLMVPIDVCARGASQQDFELSIVGDLEVNPTLLHMLRVDHGIDIDEAELFEHAEMDGVIDTPEEMRLAFNWLSSKCVGLPDWAIGERFILGNFWYAKLPMVRDLEASIDVIESHEIAAAMAGDSDARRGVVEQRQTSGKSRQDVDELMPAGEFNVLDSDSSQSFAIARALDGENLVLKGPPGTGKSQTIANLICGAIGQGKRVLFVAEKRAAIEAVTKRLTAAGLGDLVLDMHRGGESRKWLARS